MNKPILIKNSLKAVGLLSLLLLTACTAREPEMHLEKTSYLHSELSEERFTFEEKSKKTATKNGADGDTLKGSGVVEKFTEELGGEELTQEEDLATSPSDTTEVGKLLTEAYRWIGIPYDMTNNSFSVVTPGQYKDGKNIFGKFKGVLDCSRFVQTSFKKIGINLPRTAQMQYDYKNQKTVTTTMDWSKAQPGDIIYFWGTYGSKATAYNTFGIGAAQSIKAKNISHVGIYLGNGKMIHASSKKNPCQVVTIAKWHKDRFAGIKRATKK